MAYIGNQPSESFTSFATQEFSTSATTSYTLDHAVTNENEIALFINNVRQQPGSGKAYTATGTALTLSEATASTDTMYCVFLGRALQTVNPATNSITNAMVSSSAAIAGSKLGAGAILQMVTTSVTDTLTETVGANTLSSNNITDLATSITPSSSSNKILILANLNVGRANTDGNAGVGIQLLRGSTIIGSGDAASSRSRVASFESVTSNNTVSSMIISHVDSPSSTSSTTYNFRFLNADGDSSALYINRSSGDADAAYSMRCASSVTLFEIGA